jgi:hypothetical protein
MELGVSKSRLLGVGLEYADYREYQDTDDVKRARFSRSINSQRLWG